MLTQLSFVPRTYVLSVFLCIIALMLLNTSGYAADATNDGAMTVLSMEDMGSLAGGAHRGPNWSSYREACSGGWSSCPSISTRTYRDCSCTGPLQSQPCSTHWNGVPLWKDFSCGRDWIGRCKRDGATGAQGGIRYRCS